MVIGIYLGFSILGLGFITPAVAQDAYNLIQPLPGVGKQTTGFLDYVDKLIPFILAFAALAAFVQIVRGGIQRAVSGGNPSAISEANDIIWKAILGLVLALSSYLIIYTINKDLVNLKMFEPLSIQAVPGGISNTEEEAQQTLLGKQWILLRDCQELCSNPNPNFTCASNGVFWRCELKPTSGLTAEEQKLIGRQYYSLTGCKSECQNPHLNLQCVQNGAYYKCIQR